MGAWLQRVRTRRRHDASPQPSSRRLLTPHLPQENPAGKLEGGVSVSHPKRCPLAAPAEAHPELRVRRRVIRVFRPGRVDGLPVLVDCQWSRSESRRACKPSSLGACNERADHSTDTEEARLGMTVQVSKRAEGVTRQDSAVEQMPDSLGQCSLASLASLGVKVQGSRFKIRKRALGTV